MHDSTGLRTSSGFCISPGGFTFSVAIRVHSFLRFFISFSCRNDTCSCVNVIRRDLSMMRIGSPGYNGGSPDLRAVLLYDVVILARRSSNRSCTPSSRFSFVGDGRHVASRLFSNSSAGDGNFASIGVARIWSSACGMLSDVFKHFFITGLTHLTCL